MGYAETTTVPFERSVSEIVTLIKTHGAAQIGQFEGEDAFTIWFTLADRMIRFHLPIPALAEMPIRDGRQVTLTREQRSKRLAQARRTCGRALLLVIKAKLKSVESGIETVEQAFLANVVMGGGRTVYEHIAAPIALQYQGGSPDPSLGLLPPPRSEQ
jgi:hypothetical protein